MQEKRIIETGKSAVYVSIDGSSVFICASGQDDLYLEKEEALALAAAIIKHFEGSE